MKKHINNLVKRAKSVKIKKVAMPNFKSLKLNKHQLSQFKNIRLPKIKFSLKSKNKKIYFTKLSILAIIFLYIIGGLIVGYLVYKKDANSPLINKALIIYPFPAALVNNRPISVLTINKQINYVQQYSKQSCQADSSTCQKIDSYATIRDRAIDQQVENKLISIEAKKMNVGVSQKDINNAYKKIADENGGDKEVEKVLSALYGMSVRDFKNLLETQLLRDKIDQTKIQRVEVRHILVADEEKAKSVIGDINSGKISFEDAAKQYSKDSNSKDKGGSLGNVARGVMPKEFDEVAFDKTTVGKTYGEPVKTDFGFHIIRVDKKTGIIKQNFQDWLDGLKKNAKVKKFFK
jgi:foldase protein PrsA